MKIKFIVIMLCIFLFSSTFCIASKLSIDNNQETTNLDDVPVWNVGDYWVYSIDQLTVDFQSSSQRIYIDGSIDDFKWTVSDTSGSTYTVDFTGKINANYEIYLSSPSLEFYITGTIKDTLTKLSGTIIFTKSDLQIQGISGEIRGITMGKISPLPFSLPLPFKAIIGGSLSTPFPLFDFPLDTNKFWNMPDLTAQMSINAGGIFGLISIPMTATVNYGWTPLAFHCKNIQQITVEAGTFDAWEIESTFFDLFSYYYAPDVGNLVKIDVTMDNGEFHGELKSTNFIN